MRYMGLISHECDDNGRRVAYRIVVPRLGLTRRSKTDAPGELGKLFEEAEAAANAFLRKAVTEGLHVEKPHPEEMYTHRCWKSPIDIAPDTAFALLLRWKLEEGLEDFNAAAELGVSKESVERMLRLEESPTLAQLTGLFPGQLRLTLQARLFNYEEDIGLDE